MVHQYSLLIWIYLVFIGSALLSNVIGFIATKLTWVQINKLKKELRISSHSKKITPI